MTAAAAAALLDRGGLSVDAASAAAPVVSRQWGSPTVRYIQWLEEESPLNMRTAVHTSDSYREHVALPLTSYSITSITIIDSSENKDINLAP